MECLLTVTYSDDSVKEYYLGSLEGDSTPCGQGQVYWVGPNPRKHGYEENGHIVTFMYP